MSWVVVGVDCATEDDRIGLAYGTVDAEGRLELKRATLGTAGESAAATVTAWIADAGRHVVAFDAPLGWPERLAAALAGHRAGAAIGDPAEQLFRRQTDRVVQAELGRLPPAVGADRVARTAHAALGLLQEIRASGAAQLPLAWTPGVESGAIEVLPAATLLSRGITPGGYKTVTASGRKARATIFDRLEPELHTRLSRELLIEDDDLLDAALCVVGAADFARGQARAPEDLELAEREGWIWFRGTGQGSLF